MMGKEGNMSQKFKYSRNVPNNSETWEYEYYGNNMLKRVILPDKILKLMVFLSGIM